jgi:hypothetical protein
MLRRALRAALFTIVLVVLWTVSRPAMAMPAPFCDDRGATAMAAEPLLEAPDVAVQRARAAPACDGEELILGMTVAPGHAPAPIVAGAGDPALPATTPVVPPPGFAPFTPAAAAQPRADGVPGTLERPPRA